jgi:hypothetical protein
MATIYLNMNIHFSSSNFSFATDVIQENKYKLHAELREDRVQCVRL